MQPPRGGSSAGLVSCGGPAGRRATLRRNAQRQRRALCADAGTSRRHAPADPGRACRLACQRHL